MSLTKKERVRNKISSSAMKYHLAYHRANIYFSQLKFIHIIAIFLVFMQQSGQNKATALETKVNEIQPLVLTERALKNEWRQYDALQDCPNTLSVDNKLFRREFASYTFQVMYDWAETEELLEGTLTEDELQEKFEFADLPIDVQTSFLEYACEYDEDCSEIDDLSTKVNIPMGDSNDESKNIAKDLCSQIAIHFDDVFNHVKRVADQLPTFSPTLTLVPSLSPSLFSQSPTFKPTIHPTILHTLIPTIISSETPTIVIDEPPQEEGDLEVGDTIETIQPTNSSDLNEDDDIVVFSFAFKIRAAGSQFFHTELLEIGSQLEDELQRKTRMILKNDESRLRALQETYQHQHKRNLASLVDAKIRSLEPIGKMEYIVSFLSLCGVSYYCY